MPPRSQTRTTNISIKAIDLFCGVGGLTSGLERTGIDVALGVDLNDECEYPYETNNRARFLLKSVEQLSGDDFTGALDDENLSLLAGCAPCQPFSTYLQGRAGPSDTRWNLLGHFARLIQECQPDLVTMENVPRLAHQRVFKRFIRVLKTEGFFVSFAVVNCADYGVPQYRNRLVLLASKLGPIALRAPTTPSHKHRTVRQTIGHLPALAAGDVCSTDRLHQACGLSPLNLARIRASQPGGTWRDWDDHLVADCHKRSTGQSYPSIYGRMEWDRPAPTMTTQYYGFGSGRFGHPEQDRAISLREGAILQSFPRSYKFVAPTAPIHRKSIGRLIGNAVPVNLGYAIGQTIVTHVQQFSQTTRTAG